MRSLLLFILVLAATWQLKAQKALTIDEARGQMKTLDSLYKSAVNTDSAKAVFNTKESSEKLIEAYRQMHHDLADHLKKNGFEWGMTVKFFNRVYFNASGGIDYFLYNIRGKPEELPSEEKQKEFKRLLQVFVEQYDIGIKADVKFVQCSPSTHLAR